MQSAVGEPGQHVVIFGERGVGKTSLANMTKIISEISQGRHRVVVKYNCSKATGYAALWENVFHQIPFATQLPAPAGYTGEKATRSGTMRDLLPPASEITPEKICYYLQRLCTVVEDVVIIIDEFDRIKSADAIAGLADTIKNLSDNAIAATIILVGAAHSVDQLIAEHSSLKRALVQVRIPRMSLAELHEIMDLGFTQLQMKILPGAKRLIAGLAQGLPHYVHLLAKYAAEAAFESKSDVVEEAFVRDAMRIALENCDESSKNTYYRATVSAQDNLFREILLACALTPQDEMGFFAPADLKDAVRYLLATRPYETLSFSRYLNEFCSENRGPILERTGRPRNYRYRFVDPLIEPYVVLKGLTDGLVAEATIDALAVRTTSRVKVVYGGSHALLPD